MIFAIRPRSHQDYLSLPIFGLVAWRVRGKGWLDHWHSCNKRSEANPYYQGITHFSQRPINLWLKMGCIIEMKGDGQYDYDRDR